MRNQCDLFYWVNSIVFQHASGLGIFQPGSTLIKIVSLTRMRSAWACKHARLCAASRHILEGDRNTGTEAKPRAVMLMPSSAIIKSHLGLNWRLSETIVDTYSFQSLAAESNKMTVKWHILSATSFLYKVLTRKLRGTPRVEIESRNTMIRCSCTFRWSVVHAFVA